MGEPLYFELPVSQLLHFVMVLCNTYLELAFPHKTSEVVMGDIPAKEQKCLIEIAIPKLISLIALKLSTSDKFQ